MMHQWRCYSIRMFVLWDPYEICWVILQ